MPTLTQMASKSASSDFVGPSDWEQLQLELVNRARANPTAEANSQGTSIGTGVSADASQPLAIIPELDASAQGHSNDMLAQNFFAHNNPNTGKSPFVRMNDAGYSYLAAAENIGWIGAFDTPYSADRIEAHHVNLWNSLSHRQAFMNDAYSEVGMGFATGPYNYQGTTYQSSSMMTQNFGDRGFTYLTGVIIDDHDGDAFYDVGEGQGGVSVTATNTGGISWSTTSWASGGYALRLAAGTYTVVFASGELDGYFETTVTIADVNVKLDVIEDIDAQNSSPQPSQSTLPDMAGDGTVYSPTATEEAANAAHGVLEFRGDADSFDGDEIFNFGHGDKLVFQDAGFDADAFQYNANTGDLIIGGSASAALKVYGSFSDAGFLLSQMGDDTAIELVQNVANLREHGKLADAAINGVISQEYLSGENAGSFTITIDTATASKFVNTLGVYEVTPGGEMVDVLVLASNANNGGSFTITDVDAANELGFFIIQNGGHLDQATLNSTNLDLQDDGGTVRLYDGSLLIDGARVFVSHDASLNPDNAQHVASGLARDGSSALVIGFEDRMRNGASDDDFQDVAFRVEAEFDLG